MAITKRMFDVRNLRWVLYGALFFWTPDILIHAIGRYNFNGHDVILVSLVCPLVLIAGYFATTFFSDHRISALQPGLVILGIWLAGGFAIMVASSFGGGGFMSPGGWSSPTSLLILSGICPLTTYMLSAYDGSLFALLGITLLMGLEMAVLSARRIQIRFSSADA